MSSDDRASSLGPVVARIGPLLHGSTGIINIVVNSVAILIGLGLFGLGITAVIASVAGLGPGRPLVLGIAVLIGLSGLLLTAFVVVNFTQYVRMTVTIHEHGLTIGQPWFRRVVVPWQDVTMLSPPDGSSWQHTFHLTHRSGRRILVNRLSLKPTRPSDLSLSLIHHPDVETVLAHYAQWQARTGR